MRSWMSGRGCKDDGCIIVRIQDLKIQQEKKNMITLIEALNFRSLRYISQPLGSFHILVGPNASGKTTFLDVIAFINQLVSNGLETAVSDRARNFHDLLWLGQGNRFELAIEAKIPDEIVKKFSSQTKEYDVIRYEIAIGID